jgi:hypothetical protein
MESNMIYDEDTVDRKVAKAAGIGTAVGFTGGFLLAIMILYIVGVNL